jgi:hypothetical protein
METQLTDITLHIDENLGKEARMEVEEKLRSVDGVVSVHNPDNHPHLTIVEYNPEKTRSKGLLSEVKSFGVHAELIGL